MGYTKDTVLGFSWMSGYRVITRIIAIVRTGILARLLFPDQFGAFGIAALVLSFLEIMTETGINLFLVQEGEEIDKYLNTAWVISIIRGTIISITIFLLAKPISIFFNSPSSYELLVLISLVPFIRGFINPYVVKFQIDLAFNKEFLYRTSLFIVDALVAVIVVLYTKSAVGIIWGIVAGGFVEMITSFFIFKIKPVLRFEKEKARKIINRGKWITAGGIFRYLTDQGDDAVVGKLLNTYSLGLYQNAYKISTLPVTEVTGVAAKVVLPVYTRIRADKKRLKHGFIKASIIISLMSLTLGLLIIIFSKSIILIILGQNWLEVEPALKILAIFGIFASIGNIPNALFIAVKRQDVFAKLRAVQLIVLALLIFPLTKKMGIVGASYSALASSVVIIPLIIYYLKKVFEDE